MSIKKELYDHCIAYVQCRINASKEAIAGAQLSANEETKSSAGDKYETGRAMAQLEIEKNTFQLNESKKLMVALDQIKDVKNALVLNGSVVHTNHGNFYISISAGQFTIDGIAYFAISPASPMGQHLMGLPEGGKFSFNKRNFVVTQID